MRRRAALILALAIVVTLLPTAAAQACSCIKPDAGRFLAERDFVFVGSLIAEPAGRFRLGGLGADMVPYTFEVEAVYKGDLRDPTIDVWSAANGAACGFGITAGTRVAIAASLSDGRLTGSSCSMIGVDRLEAAAADAGIEPTFPTGSPPTAAGVAGEETDPAFGSGAVVLLAALAGVAVFGLVAGLRRAWRD